MFSLTPAASVAMIAAREDLGAPDDWGIRFFAPIEGQPGVAFDFVPTPEPDDVLGGSGKLPTYVDSGLHRDLGDATVDYQELDGSPEIDHPAVPGKRAALRAAGLAAPAAHDAVPEAVRRRPRRPSRPRARASCLPPPAGR